MNEEQIEAIFKAANQIMRYAGRHKIFLSQYPASEMALDIKNELFEIKYILEQAEKNLEV
jgi:hypothetical protein